MKKKKKKLKKSISKNQSKIKKRAKKIPKIFCAKNYLSIETINQLKKEIGVIN